MLSENLITHNCRVKSYPDADGNYQPYEALVTAKPCFRETGWELCDDGARGGAYNPDKPKKREATDPDRSRSVSFARARNKCFDLLMCNTFADKERCNLFVTLTFDAAVIDRYSYADVVTRLGRWLDNRVRRHGLKYILVPELHKDGAVHFHGVMNESALKLVWSGVVQKGKRVYNIADFPLGFTNVKRISGRNSTEAVSKYVFKYLTKSAGEKVGGRYYLRGGALSEPRFERLTVDFGELRASADRAFQTDYLGECLLLRLHGKRDVNFTF